jgi:hypothetical protein
MTGTETLTRITLIIPAPQSYRDYINLDTLLTELIKAGGGATASRGTRRGTTTVFDGLWLNPANEPKGDSVILILCDVPFLLKDSDAGEWVEWLNTMKHWLQTIFLQDIVWMTLHQVTRSADFDYRRDWYPVP